MARVFEAGVFVEEPEGDRVFEIDGAPAAPSEDNIMQPVMRPVMRPVTRPVMRL